MKMRGWPRGPPPPSQEVLRPLIQRTGCLWMRSMAAMGRGCRHQLVNLFSVSSSRLFRCPSLSSSSSSSTVNSQVFPLHSPNLTWSAIIICSNLGPTMAFSRGCWLRLHTSLRLGACMVRMRSPSATLSCRAWSMLPSELNGISLVLLTGLCEGRSTGSLAGTGLSVTRRRAAALKLRLLRANMAPLRRSGAVNIVMCFVEGECQLTFFVFATARLGGFGEVLLRAKTCTARAFPSALRCAFGQQNPLLHLYTISAINHVYNINASSDSFFGMIFIVSCTKETGVSMRCLASMLNSISTPQTGRESRTVPIRDIDPHIPSFGDLRPASRVVRYDRGPYQRLLTPVLLSPFT